jgi:hypothetical protein
MPEVRPDQEAVDSGPRLLLYDGSAGVGGGRA